MQGVHFQCLEVSPNVLGPGIWNRKETKWPHYRKFESVFISWGIEINTISFTEMIHRNYSLKGDRYWCHSGFGPRSFIHRGFYTPSPASGYKPQNNSGGPFPLSLQNRRNFYAFFGRNGGASHARGVRTPLKIFFSLLFSYCVTCSSCSPRVFLQSPVKRTKFTAVCR